MIDTIEAERQTFLDDIIANPDDDAVRLIYADWLTDHGESERAEFIRVQVKIANYPARVHALSRSAMKRGCTCNVCNLRRRERDLWLSSEILPWFPGFDGYVMLLMRPSSLGSDDPPIAVVRRGFVAEIDCDWQDWNAQADEIVEQHPIEEVRLLTWPVIRRLDSPSIKTRWTLEGRTYKPYWEDGEPNRTLLIQRLLKFNWPTVGKFTLPEAQS